MKNKLNMIMQHATLETNGRIAYLVIGSKRYIFRDGKYAGVERVEPNDKD